MHIKTIGLDLAKSVFQAHGIDEAGDAVLVKKLHRKQMIPFFSKLPAYLIGVEACATAHHWARTVTAIGARGADHAAILRQRVREAWEN